MRRHVLMLVFGVAISGAAVQAHHAISAYHDAAKPVTLDAVITRFHFVNPHPFLTVDVADRSGTTQSWKLEMDNRFELAAIGVTSDTLKPGDRIVVTGSLARDQANSLYVRRLDRPADGFRYEQVGASPRIRRGA